VDTGEPVVIGLTRGGQTAVEPSPVLLVTAERAVSRSALRRAAELAGDAGPVTVIAIAWLHGSGLGAPHPGLLPTPQEREQGRRIVATAMSALEEMGARTLGSVVITRTPGRTIARAARSRGARAIVLDMPPRHGLRRVVEGDLTAELRRRLRSGGITVETPTRDGRAGAPHSGHAAARLP
jgi:hypothetical protein